MNVALSGQEKTKHTRVCLSGQRCFSCGAMQLFIDEAGKITCANCGNWWRDRQLARSVFRL